MDFLKVGFGEAVFAALVDGQVVGYAAFFEKPEDALRTGFVEPVYASTGGWNKCVWSGVCERTSAK